MKKETYLRVFMILFFVSLIIFFYPKYDYLTNYTVKSLVILSSYIIGVTPSYYNNDIFYKFETITTVNVSPECSGLITLLVFAIVIWIIPNIDLKNRIYAFALIPVIFFSNILRLLVAIAIGKEFGADSIILYHATAGQVFTFIVLISCFVLFIKISNKEIYNKELKNAQ